MTFGRLSSFTRSVIGATFIGDRRKLRVQVANPLEWLTEVSNGNDAG